MVIPTYCITRKTTISIDITHGIGVAYIHISVMFTPPKCSTQDTANYISTTTITILK